MKKSIFCAVAGCMILVSGTVFAGCTSMGEGSQSSVCSFGSYVSGSNPEYSGRNIIVFNNDKSNMYTYVCGHYKPHQEYPTTTWNQVSNNKWVCKKL